jgi:hypothetical protein
MISNAGIILVLLNLSLSIFSLSILAIRLLLNDIGRSNEYEISSGFSPIFDRQTFYVRVDNALYTAEL